MTDCPVTASDKLKAIRENNSYPFPAMAKAD